MMVMKTTNQHPRRDTKEFMEKSNEMIFDPNDSDLFQRFFAQNPDPKDIRVLDDAQYNQYAKFLALLREAHSYLNGARQQSKDPKMAFKIFKEAAELGCAEGQYNLGHLYANGLGTNADYALMLRYYRLAAEHKPFVKWGARIMSELGVAEAENALGNVYRDGRGVDVDYAKAFRHYTRAASWGQPEAQNNMGCFLSNGLGVAKNYQFARSWFERAAKHGLAEAQMNYAEMLEDGRGGPVDEEGALEYFQKAAKQGMPGAIEALHRMAVNGSASQPHKAAFEDLLKSSTANKDINALFFKGNMENEMRNYDEAVICWKAAADLGHLESKIVLWNLLLHRKRQNESAFLYCLEASQAGDVESQLRLTVLYATGTGCARDAAAAKKWFQRAVSRIPGESSQYMSQKEFDELLVTAERVCSFETRMSLSSKGLKWEQRLLRYMEARDVSEDDRRMIENYRHIQRLSELPDPLPVSTNIPSIIRKPDMQAVILAAERGSTVAADVAKAWMMNAEALQAWDLGNHNMAFSLFREAQKYHDVVEIHNFDMVAFIEEQSLNTTDAMFVKACHFGNNIQGSIYYVLRCIRKHPMEADFHNLLANLYGFAGRFDDSLSSAQRAYEIEARPNFLYTIATAMRMRLPAPDERRKKIKQKLYDKARLKVIEAYLKFLDHNPRDHRKVPTVLFCLASLHLTSDMSEMGKCASITKKRVLRKSDVSHVLKP
ncbi:uncharacterized protein LOC129589560 [Paramacrobiotus metropolitanus]|uniref:uncharacterized protein LOC129589560 n=1 Tax=Paramacrobiotus metropolitanus TaxID=2943436 RepID=UPI002445DBEA|nr:uncharacterized protein LOC129589560 [Paramacrobiotus metropolitanus]